MIINTRIEESMKIMISSIDQSSILSFTNLWSLLIWITINRINRDQFIICNFLLILLLLLIAWNQWWLIDPSWFIIDPIHVIWSIKPWTFHILTIALFIILMPRKIWGKHNTSCGKIWYLYRYPKTPLLRCKKKSIYQVTRVSGTIPGPLDLTFPTHIRRWKHTNTMKNAWTKITTNYRSELLE